MKSAKLSLSAALLATGFVLTALPAFATVDFAKKEKKACTYCHVKMGSKDLNDVGKCYQKNKNSLKGCEEKDEKGKEKSKGQ
jgi:hypothetical protein